MEKKINHYDTNQVSFYLINVDSKNSKNKNLVFKIKQRAYAIMSLIDHRLRLHNKLFTQPTREALLIVHHGVIHYLKIGYDPKIHKTISQEILIEPKTQQEISTHSTNAQ